MQERLGTEITYSKGLLKLWNWSGMLTDPYSKSLKLERAMGLNSKNIPEEELLMGMSMDICFLKKATEDYKNANKKNHIPVYLNYSKSSDD